MDERDWLAERFEEQRTRLRAVAYRMLGSISEADDAVQEAWLRVTRADTSEVENLGAWLTTVVSRVSLNMLRSRRVRHEEPFDAHVPEPIVDRADGTDPQHEALLADSVGLALLVVLETLAPAERIGASSRLVRGSFTARRPSPVRRLRSRGSTFRYITRSSTGPRARSRFATDGRSRSRASRSGTGGSSRWTSSPIPTASPGST